MDEWEITKSSGEEHHLNKKKGQTRKWSRSNHWYDKQNKARGLRRKADRHSHHRRRNHIRNQVARGTLDAETIPPPSSTKAFGCGSGHSYPISNRKTM